MSDYSFNLIDEAWIPCILATGQNKIMGLRELLNKAHCIEGFDLQNPLEEAALYRLLLALVHRVVDGPRNSKEWKALYLADSLDQEKIMNYFDKWYDRFDLFSQDSPFFQTAGLELIDKKKEAYALPITLIQLSKASGNQKTLFDHSRDEEVFPMSPAEASRSLLVAQNYLLGGLNKKETNYFGYQFRFEKSVMTYKLFCLLQGQNLFKTLALNLPVLTTSSPIPSTASDQPLWERENDLRVGAITPDGYFDYMTCKGRHILFLPRLTAKKDIIVRSLYMAQGVQMESVPCPFGLYKKNNTRPMEDIPIKLVEDRTLWRDSEAIFSFSDNNDRRPFAFRHVGNAIMRKIVEFPNRQSCMIYGIATNKDYSVAKLWRKESFRFPTKLLSSKDIVDRLKFGMTLIQNAGEILQIAAKLYVECCLPKDTRKTEIRKAMNASGVMFLYWSQTELPYRKFMEDVDRGNEMIDSLKKDIKSCARKAFKTCFEHRFTSSGKTYCAWVRGSAALERGLAKKLGKEGGNG